MFSILTRRQAAESGQKRYYTGRPCGKGHDCQRFTSTGVCTQCAAGYVKSYNSRLTKRMAAHAAGQFFYTLHPDDHATVLALCQALDAARGITPTIPDAAPPPAPFDAVAARELAFGKVLQLTGAQTAGVLPPPQSTVLHPYMAAQLREHKAIK